MPPRCSPPGLFGRATSSAIRLRLRRVSNTNHPTAMDMLGHRVIGNGMVAFSIGYPAHGYSNAETSTGSRTIGTRSEISGTTCAVIGSRRATAAPQFLNTMRPTTFPARSSSIHFWTSPIGSSLMGVGLILPERASAISSFASARVPTMKPSMVIRL